ncbi:hypothetical protein LXL04_035458 [Taraxacum kok-saghyz]
MTAGVCECEVETHNGDYFSGGSVDVIGDKGFRNCGIIVECSGLQTSCTILGSAILKDDQVKEVKEEADVNGVSKELIGKSCEVDKVNCSENISDGSLVLSQTAQPWEDSKSQGTISPLLPLLVEDTIPRLSDIVGDDDEQMKDDPKFLTEDTEFVESDVKLHENVAILDDNQIEFELRETTDVPILIFPDTIASPQIQIQFGSFGLHEKDVKNGETEQTSGINNGDTEIILDDLQGNKSANKTTDEVDKDIDDVAPLSSSLEDSSEAIETEVERFDEEKFKEQIKNARIQLDEKERCRDAIGAEIKEKIAIVESYYEAFETASMEVIAARSLRKSKQEELDLIESLLNKVKNDEDIDNKMYNMERMIETRNKRYKTLDDLSNLQKEVESLTENVVKAEAAALATGKTYEEENKKGEELVAQFRDAQKVCQQAYEHLCSLKKHLYDKKKNHNMHKEDMNAVSNVASGGDKVALHLSCANQVDTFMEEKNTNDEFREYDIKRIRPSTIDETSHVSDISEKVATNLLTIPSEMEFVLVVSNVDEEKKIPDNQTMVKVVSKIEEEKETVSPPDNQTMVKVVLKVEEEKETVSPPDNQTMVKVVLEVEEEKETVSPPDNQTMLKVVSKVEEGEKIVSPLDNQTMAKVGIKVEEEKKTVSSPDNQTMVNVVSKVEEEEKMVSPLDNQTMVKVSIKVEEERKTVSSPDNQIMVNVVSKVEEGNKTVSAPDNHTMVKVVSKVEEEKKTVLSPDNQTMVKVARKTNRMMKTKEPVNFIITNSKFVCLSEITEDGEKENTVVEIDRKEEDKLSKEQIRLEENKKMNEVMVRKTRKAKKVQKQTELRAQKEAEQKEKLREKRLRQKERKKTRGDSRMEDKKIVKPNEANEIEKTGVLALTSVWRPWKTVTALVRVLCSF